MLWAVWGFLIYMLLIGMAAGWLAWVVLGRSKVLMRDRKPNWTVLLVSASSVRSSAGSQAVSSSRERSPCGPAG